MAPCYLHYCEELHWQKDEKLVKQLKDANVKALADFEKGIEDATANEGDTEVRAALLKKAEYLCKIGDKEAALSQMRLVADKPGTIGARIDLAFLHLRLGLFFMDHDLIQRNLKIAQDLIDEGGDWDRKNRLKVYRGVYSMAIRDLKKAADLFLDTVATFTSYELMDFPQFVTYSVLCGILSLKRPDFRKKVKHNPEIVEALHGLPIIREFVHSFYDSHYEMFFKRLADVEQILKYDRFLCEHYRYYVREARILAYSQLLSSYRSLTLDYMAKAFGVSTDFIDDELSRFISAGRLSCKIDRMNMIVETTRPDTKNFQYQTIIKQGDLILNRIQKLGRVVNV